MTTVTLPNDGVLRRPGMSEASNHYENKTEVAIYVLLDPETGRVLLEFRLPPWPPISQWCFGSGRVDPGEAGKHAALRELHEELGVMAVEMSDLGSFQDVNGRTFHPWLITDWAGEVPLTNADQKYPLAWWDADKLPHGCNAVTHEVARRVTRFVKAQNYA
jgi:8-oxo-dGTP pyrophosphatase MutT (NUDIX family)